MLLMRTGLVWRMDIIPDSAVAVYRRDHGRRLMILATLKNAAPGRDDFCRIRSVETVAPGLWVTAVFLDGAIRRFRPDVIRLATPDEERFAAESGFSAGDDSGNRVPPAN